MALSRTRIRFLRWLSAFQRRVIPNEKFGEVTVLYATSDADRRKVLAEQVKLAFGLLKLRAPQWYRRVQSEVMSLNLIELGPTVGLARFEFHTRECILNSTPLLENPAFAVADIAMALVHEAAHGWLFRHGVRPSTAEELQRVERICNHAEACLVARVPEVPLLAEIVAMKRAKIAEVYSSSATAGRRRAYFKALLFGIVGRQPPHSVRPNER